MEVHPVAWFTVRSHRRPQAPAPASRSCLQHTCQPVDAETSYLWSNPPEVVWCICAIYFDLQLRRVGAFIPGCYSNGCVPQKAAPPSIRDILPGNYLQHRPICPLQCRANIRTKQKSTVETVWSYSTPPWSNSSAGEHDSVFPATESGLARTPAHHPTSGDRQRIS